MARSRIVGLARVDGYPVGVMINNPKRLGGSTDVAAGTKVIRFLQLCDTFHLPMIYLADEPGFMVGPEQQRQGIVRAGAKMLCATLRTRMPWISIIIRQLYGRGAGQCHDRPSGMFKRVAWPSGHWGSMHIFRRRLRSISPHHRGIRRPGSQASGDRSALGSAVVAIPHARVVQHRRHYRSRSETRPMVCEFVRMAQPMLESQLGISPTPYMP